MGPGVVSLCIGIVYCRKSVPTFRHDALVGLNWSNQRSVILITSLGSTEKQSIPLKNVPIELRSDVTPACHSAEARFLG